jgi:hypothetical protein
MKTRIIQDEPFELAEGPTGGDGPPVGGRPVKGVAARVGRWSANHWKTAVFGWLAFVVASMLIGNVVAPKYLETSETNVGESRRADKLIDSGFPSKADEQSEVVLIQSRTATPRSERSSRTPRGRWRPSPRSRSCTRRLRQPTPTSSPRTSTR